MSFLNIVSSVPSLHVMSVSSQCMMCLYHLSVCYVCVVRPPRWPSGLGDRLGSGRSGVRIPLATGFFRIESYQ